MIVMKLSIKHSLLCISFLVAFLVRLYGFGKPIADWHSFRQSDTAAVARNYLKFGVDPLRPRHDDLSNIQSGKDNPEGYRMVEFPLYQLIAVSFSHLPIKLPIEAWLRLTTIFASSGVSVLLGLLVWRFVSPLAGGISAFTYALLPYSIYYGRTVLPDTLMVFFSVVSVYCLVRSIDRDEWIGRWFILSAVAGASALLVKPVGVFLFGPLGYLFLVRPNKRIGSVLAPIVFCLIAFLPVWLWRQWILQFPEGIPVYGWLFNDGNIRFKGAWFYWIFAERIAKLILGYWGVVPLVLGFLVRPEKKERFIFMTWIAGGLSYVAILAAGNVRHDYYQILLLPMISVYVGKGLAYILTERRFIPVIRYSLGGVVVLFMGMFSWYTIRTYYWINKPEIVEAGKAADQILPKDAKVIASYNGDTTFLYQINRQGWPLGFEIDKKIEMGATHYVTISPTDEDGETRDLASRYAVLMRNERFAIIDLTKPKGQ
ncbi:MAG: glycosyltransferase family 39 protein [bacterium]|nr:glycosyltransferase family 39 protein [bacterium]